MRPPSFFVVLAQFRSGSNLLLSGLDAHPNIATYGEVFMKDRRKRMFFGRASDSSCYRDGQDGAGFVDEFIFHSRYGQEVMAAGFKLMCGQAGTTAARTVWNRIVNDTEILVVRVRRRNLFEALVSNEVAFRTQQWMCLRYQTPRTTPPFSLDLRLVRTFFEWTTRWEDWGDNAFKQHRSLIVEYESDLAANYGPTIARVHRFLGVAPRVSQPLLVKQATCAPAEQISNYWSLRESFKSGQYARFFN